ncbi:glycosyl hydrolase [Micromonospora sp. B11E3]|uniref:glycosyl hydrolase n=1 Tax=Micromonospora sp. B11E3 TaxID=3153562 RepID=UPI00325EA177
MAAVFLAILPLPAAPATAAPADGVDTPVDMVDPQATPETRSLFAYLRDLDDRGVLFGHQEDLYFGESFEQQDGTSSDVRAATGDYPAIIGFDTLERPGMSLAEREEKALVLAANIRQAHDVGAISTMTVHMENLVTGGEFSDTSGDALRAVLPGGSRHDALVAHLDRIATTAHHAVDADGTLIPIVFRPWHENAGSWFWWGAAFGTPGEYAELFRFTVEYLRDVKGVHNLLYAFSPGGGFGGDAERYLRTYPGDEFVDVLGYDTYDDTGASAQFLQGLVADLGMIANLADSRGKISAFTEFGISGGVRPDGQNASTTWYTDVLNAIKADPSAARIAYMLTWANYGGDTTPYTPVDGEMLPDFLAYYADPFTLFAADLNGVYSIGTTPVTSAAAHLASPADGSRVLSGPVTLRASVTGYDADRVVVTTGAGPTGTTTDVQLAPPAAGELWWSGTWDVPAAELDNSTRGLTLSVFSGGAEVATEKLSILLGAQPELPPGVVDDFEGYGDDVALHTTYVQYNANTIGLVRASQGAAVGGGDAALRLGYSFATQTYTGVGRQVSGDWSAFGNFEAWIDPDGSGNKLVLQLVADGVAFEAYPSLAGDDPYLATIPFTDWRPAPWDTANVGRRLDAATLREVTQFSVYVNAADGGANEGAVVVDELRAVPGAPAAPAYRDVPTDHPDYEAIEWLHQIVDLGDRNGRFHPQRPVTHQELAAVLAAYRPNGGVAPSADRTPATRLDVASALWRLAGEPDIDESTRFRDVPADHPAAPAVAWSTTVGIIVPIAESRFGAELPATRAELAHWLHVLDALPVPQPVVSLFDFESGAQGWSVGGGAGTVTTNDGRLVVDLDAGAWVGGAGGGDLAGRTALLVDVAATTGTGLRAALQVGPGWTWCETAAVDRVDGPHTGEEAVVIDLTTLGAECRDQLAQVRGINLFFDAGHHEVDGVRAR